MLGVTQGRVDEGGHMGVVQRVDDVANVPTSSDQSEVTQDTQLMGYGGLLHPHRRSQSCDGAGALPQPNQQPHAARGRKARHHPRDVVGLVQREP